ncbi:hypothetical protein AA0X95_04875 [Bacillus sp. 1P10SD]|uniref:hypothetical protein n=1 Tax=Bacillus sp. 1P10SD TaxID=3132265 RepID=UPI0039A7640F
MSFGLLQLTGAFVQNDVIAAAVFFLVALTGSLVEEGITNCEEYGDCIKKGFLLKNKLKFDKTNILWVI